MADLPALEAELATGAMSYGIVRELTRVATPVNEQKWIAVSRGKNLRQVERLVAGHKKGDAPDDDVDADLFECVVEWKLPAPIHAQLRETRKHLNDEMGSNLDDSGFVETLCRRALESAEGGGGPTRMIHISTCPRCKSSTQVGAGRRVPISVTELELASCDATIVDRESGDRPTQSIPAARRREVMERDDHRCRAPGCRATRNLDVHHLTPRSLGGRHELWNLVVLCAGHHRLHHEGVMTISGRADGELTFTRRGRALVDDKATHVFARHLQIDDDRTMLARRALQQSGYKANVAAAAVERATGIVAPDADLATLLREALRHCR